MVELLMLLDCIQKKKASVFCHHLRLLTFILVRVIVSKNKFIGHCMSMCT